MKRNYEPQDCKRPHVEMGRTYMQRLNALPDDHPCKANSGLIFLKNNIRDPQIGGDFTFNGYY